MWIKILDSNNRNDSNFREMSHELFDKIIKENYVPRQELNDNRQVRPIDDKPWIGLKFGLGVKALYKIRVPSFANGNEIKEGSLEIDNRGLEDKSEFLKW